VPLYIALEILKILAYCNINSPNLTCSEYAHYTMSKVVPYSVVIIVCQYQHQYKEAIMTINQD
jgi:hypothetical protein